MNPNPSNLSFQNFQGNGGPPPGSHHSIAQMHWRSGISREHRQELISKIYNELIRATGEAPGPTVWMKASNYELKLFHESQDRDGYLTKISRRLYLLSQRPTMMNPFVQQMRQMQQQQSMNMMQQSSQMNAMSANNGQPVSQMQPNAGYPPSSAGMGAYQGMPPNVGMRPSIGGADPSSGGDEAAQYWDKHAELKAKYWDDCVIVYQSFRRYVELGRPEDEQGQKLRNLLHYVQQVVAFLGEERGKNPAKPIKEIRKAEAYIQKIVLPYLSKLNMEKAKHGSDTTNLQNHSNTGVYPPHSGPRYPNVNPSNTVNSDDFGLAFASDTGLNENTSSSPFDLSMGLNSSPQANSGVTSSDADNVDDSGNSHLINLVETL